MNSENLLERLVCFGARCIAAAQALPKSDIGRHVSLQLMRSATSAGANYSEGCGAESKRDFGHKLKISVKELREADYWLRLIEEAEMLPAERLRDLRKENDELIAISVASIKMSGSRDSR